MKLIIKTNKPGKTLIEKTYLVRLPNYFNTDKVGDLLQQIELEHLRNEEITEHMIYGDNFLTLEERKELDTAGKVIHPPIELNIKI